MPPSSLPARCSRSMAAGVSARANMNEADATCSLIGLDVGGTMIKGLVVSSAGEVLGEETTPTKDDGTKEWLERAREVVRSLSRRCSTPVRVGVAAPGLAAPDNRCITSLPNRLPGLENLN